MKDRALGGTVKWMAAIVLATALAARPAALAQEPSRENGKTIIGYEGDAKFCARLIHQASKIRWIPPTIPTPHFDNIASYGSYPTAKRIRFVDYDVDWRSFLKYVEKGEWDKLLRPGNRPTDPLGDELIIRDKRWRDLNRKCPGFLDPPNKDVYAPHEFALYKLDIDNDGKTDTVLIKQRRVEVLGTPIQNWSWVIDIYDFGRCRFGEAIAQLPGVVSMDRSEVGILRFEGRNYLFSSEEDYPATLHLRGKFSVIQKKKGVAIDDSAIGHRKDDVCVYHGIHKLTDFDPTRMVLKYKR